MAAYAALVSVMQTIHHIKLHPHPPISLYKEQVESLSTNISFLQEFIEGYNPHRSYSPEADPLERRIAEAAYAAEDVIESHIVDQILVRSIDRVEEISSIEFHQSLQKVIEGMDLIKTEVMEMTEKKMGVHIKKSTSDAAPFRSSSTTARKVTTMVGSDGVLYEMLDKITGGGAGRQIIPIVGMGGLGKTTLARNIYANPLVKEHFDIRAWSTISQVHNGTKILKEILDQVDMEEKDRGDLSEYELGEELYRYLIGRRYFVVMDDMWSIEAWDRVGKFFPDNENGSRIVVTTRLSNLASMFNHSNGLHMKFLDEATSWDLFSQAVFGVRNCPLELKDIGMKIVKGCKGLPLSIVVIGGLLSKSEPTRENWELVEENLYSIVNSEDNERCLQILYMSYNNLPVYLKPCFLYMGINGEDEDIPVSFLIPLWVAEGFITPIDGRSLEEAAEEYLEELVDRNLVLVERRNRYGKVKACKIHDLLRDVCLREIEKDKFLCVLGEQSIPQGMITSLRRISSTNPATPTQLFQSLESASLVRCWIGNFPETLSTSFRLLRVFAVKPFDEKEEDSRHSNSERKSRDYYEEIFFELVNLRLLFVGVDELHSLSVVPYSGSFLWNLQTLYLDNVGDDFVLEIWKMPQLRHVMTYDGTLDGAYCLSPLAGEMEEEVVLENLQTLFGVMNLNLSENVLKRIPNVKKLKLEYYETSTRVGEEEGGCCLNNLRKLESLCLRYWLDVRKQELITFPCSLKKLRLDNTELPWEEMASKVGLLPLLQVLKLKQFSCIGSEWETVEGRFLSLKFLMIERCDLEYWTTDSAHFPRLEHLVLRFLKRVREIPSSIGDIPTLGSIALEGCSDSAVESARRIVEEQEEYGNEVLKLHVI